MNKLVVKNLFNESFIRVFSICIDPLDAFLYNTKTCKARILQRITTERSDVTITEAEP